MTKTCLLAAMLLALATPAMAQDEPPTPDSVVAAAAPEEWQRIAPEDLLVMELAPAADGTGRKVVIQLLPPPFSQPWVEDIKTMARAHWWDGKSVYRVVDNWVAQWGGGDPELGMDPGPLPDGVVSPTDSYMIGFNNMGSTVKASPTLTDHYAPETHFEQGFAVGETIAEQMTWQWPVHCYGSVGVARELAPDTGTGSELYAVIGHAARQLDRNIAVVGRVIEGIEHLSTLPRGTAEAGVYAERSEDTPIVSVRLASEMRQPPAYEYLDTSSDSFARYVEVRANRSDSFYAVPAGGVDICNVQVPIRRAE
ncbi:MAG: hypothetical protein B7Y88_12565 [Sphingomonadales bacterium 32-64-17]|nr:MAG: hypothetical protein B7Y88_12565 [Sphingomonadales bacterium 32-64-17]